MPERPHRLLFSPCCQILKAQEVLNKLISFILCLSLCGDSEEKFYAIIKEILMRKLYYQTKSSLKYCTPGLKKSFFLNKSLHICLEAVFL